MRPNVLILARCRKSFVSQRELRRPQQTDKEFRQTKCNCLSFAAIPLRCVSTNEYKGIRATKLYRAKPKDVPSWAEQGNLCFMRLDDAAVHDQS
jgi:hypothetical protein